MPLPGGVTSSSVSLLICVIESLDARLGFVEVELVLDRPPDPDEDVVERALDARREGAGLGGAGRDEVGVMGELRLGELRLGE
jgi:hypothetical protein